MQHVQLHALNLENVQMYPHLQKVTCDFATICAAGNALKSAKIFAILPEQPYSLCFNDFCFYFSSRLILMVEPR